MKEPFVDLLNQTVSDERLRDPESVGDYIAVRLGVRGKSGLFVDSVVGAGSDPVVLLGFCSEDSLEHPSADYVLFEPEEDGSRIGRRFRPNE